MIPTVSSMAPEFSAPDQDDVSHSLSSYRSTWVLLYFYPKDDTPGCTKEACAIRDSFPEFSVKGLTVLGISPDSPKSHKKFIEKYDLPFTLLSDEGAAVAKQYGVWGKKKFMGREYEGILRTSFLINPEGLIAKVYESVKPEAHAADVLADMAQFSA